MRGLSVTAASWTWVIEFEMRLFHFFRERVHPPVLFI